MADVFLVKDYTLLAANLVLSYLRGFALSCLRTDGLKD